jgi:Uncharacterized protein conserved in bacteria (DUF2188)
MSETRHVVPARDGGWHVVPHPGSGDGASRVFHRRRDAEAFAKDAVRMAGGGEVVLHTPSGRIAEVDSVVAPTRGPVVR